MMRVIIVDDEKTARDEIRDLLSRSPNVDVIDEANDGDAAFKLIQRLSPDLVILNAKTPTDIGLHLAEKMHEEGIRSHVIFITTSDKYAVRAFELNAVDYLMKPVTPERMAQSLDRVWDRLAVECLGTGTFQELSKHLRASGGIQAAHVRPPKISIRKGDRVFLIDPADVTHGYILDGVVFLATAETTGLTSHRTLDELERDVDPERFWRVHRSYIVNIDHVTEVIPWQSGTYRLRLDDPEGTLVPLSRVQAKRMRRVMRW
jgi:two-component system, LytTR family, response regulator LytT